MSTGGESLTAARTLREFIDAWVPVSAGRATAHFALAALLSETAEGVSALCGEGETSRSPGDRVATGCPPSPQSAAPLFPSVRLLLRMTENFDAYTQGVSKELRDQSEEELNAVEFPPDTGLQCLYTLADVREMGWIPPGAQDGTELGGGETAAQANEGEASPAGRSAPVMTDSPHTSNPEYNEDEAKALLDPTGVCDEACARHQPDCDGSCEHLPGHINECNRKALA